MKDPAPGTALPRLTHRERVFRAMSGQTVDRVACGEFFVSDEFVRAFLSLPPGEPVRFPHHHQLVQELDLDIASIILSGGWGAPEQPDQDRALEALGRWAAEGDHYLVALIDGPFSAAALARGFNMLLHYVRGAPHLARELFRQGAEATRVIAQAVRDAGADGVILGEDIAYGRSTYISPDDLRSLYFPELANAVRQVRTLGLSVWFHSDGNLNSVWQDLAECQLDGIQGMEPEAGMQIETTRQAVGADLTLWGNLAFDFLSQPHTMQEIEDQVHALCQRACPSPAARFVFGSCAGLVRGMDPQTVRRVYQTLRALTF